MSPIICGFCNVYWLAYNALTCNLSIDWAKFIGKKLLVCRSCQIVSLITQNRVFLFFECCYLVTRVEIEVTGLYQLVWIQFKAWNCSSRLLLSVKLPIIPNSNLWAINYIEVWILWPFNSTELSHLMLHSTALEHRLISEWIVKLFGSNFFFRS